jgi:excisionase family DNA binding protein
MSAELSSARKLAHSGAAHGIGVHPLLGPPHPMHESSQPDPDRRPDLLRSSDVAALFHVSSRTVANWASAGRLRSVRTAGGQWRFPADDVATLLASARHGRPVRERA